ncbi:MAG: hypothetical protein ABWX61_00895, partial [Paenisporosarcina sp.]
LFITLIFITVVSASCSNSSWAYSFVVWNGYIYQISDEYVGDIGEEIGEVTKYSDREGTYSGNFSNKYQKGTKYYAIEEISTDEAIAIEEGNGEYRKATSKGKYGEK